MGLAYPLQRFQDWLTQQWVILSGRKINKEEVPWLIGPFGNLGGIGDDFITQLAAEENLIIERNTKSQGLIDPFQKLNLSVTELSKLSESVISFYENTALYHLGFSVTWNPFFKIGGILINLFFSSRLNQLNIPSKNLDTSESLNSEIITLTDPVTNEVKYTVWFRTLKSNGKVIYSGIYSTCTLPSGTTCVKAVFPLPKGNATVIMTPQVGANGELILDSSGMKFGDAGFYFLLTDSQGNHWSNFVRSFRDKLIVTSEDDILKAEQTLTLWNLRVLKFNYQIELKSNPPKA